MHLTPEEQAILGGKRGEAAQRALEYQVEVGRFWGAKRFVPVTNVHMMGDIEVMGDAGLEFLRNEVKQSARCAVPTTTNARCMDFAHCERLGQDMGEAKKEKEIIAALRRMDVVTTDTCINYQTVYQPHLGEHVAWGDTGTVIYANSVFGARSNFEAGPAALAAALTGRTPEYGFHLDEHRKGTFAVELKAALADLADWGAVGKLVGESHQNYYAVPVFHGYHRTPGADELKHLGAALASYGSMGMFHFVGVTPEAPSAANLPSERMMVSDADLERVYKNYILGDGDARLVVFSGPQQSLFEMKKLALLFKDKKIKTGTTCIVTTNSAVLKQSRDLGYAQALEAAGVTILEGVCFYILQNLSPMREKNRWTNMVSNSAKIVNIIGAHRFNTILRRTADCVEIACSRGFAVSSISVTRAYGPMVEGEAVVSEEGFSPRYDLDRWTGVITKPGHKLEGTSIVDKICFFPTAKGGIAAGWAFYDIKWKKIAPKAFVFGVTNPVMVQGAIFAGIPITEGWTPHPRDVVKTGDRVRVDPARRLIEVL